MAFSKMSLRMDEAIEVGLMKWENLHVSPHLQPFLKKNLHGVADGLGSDFRGAGPALEVGLCLWGGLRVVSTSGCQVTVLLE